MTDEYVTISYWNVTKNIYYSLLFIFPMLFLYESMCWIQYFGQSAEIRNGADVLLHQIIFGMVNGSEIVYGLLMIVESLLWCIGFVIIMSVSEQLLLSIMERNIIPEQFYLAIGAGIWEELLFRVGAIGLSLSFLTKVVGYSGIYSVIIAVIFSAVIFSLFHYLGPFGDNFAYKSFYLRTLAGIFLGSLYMFRGFGITVYTHIFYDMFIISMPVIFIAA